MNDKMLKRLKAVTLSVRSEMAALRGDMDRRRVFDRASNRVRAAAALRVQLRKHLNLASMKEDVLAELAEEAAALRSSLEYSTATASADGFARAHSSAVPSATAVAPAAAAAAAGPVLTAEDAAASLAALLPVPGEGAAGDGGSEGSAEGGSSLSTDALSGGNLRWQALLAELVGPLASLDLDTAVRTWHDRFVARRAARAAAAAAAAKASGRTPRRGIASRHRQLLRTTGLSHGGGGGGGSASGDGDATASHASMSMLEDEPLAVRLPRMAPDLRMWIERARAKGGVSPPPVAIFSTLPMRTLEAARAARSAGVEAGKASRDMPRYGRYLIPRFERHASDIGRHGDGGVMAAYPAHEVTTPAARVQQRLLWAKYDARGMPLHMALSRCESAPPHAPATDIELERQYGMALSLPKQAAASFDGVNSLVFEMEEILTHELEAAASVWPQQTSAAPLHAKLRAATADIAAVTTYSAAVPPISPRARALPRLLSVFTQRVKPLLLAASTRSKPTRSAKRIAVEAEMQRLWAERRSCACSSHRPLPFDDDVAAEDMAPLSEAAAARLPAAQPYVTLPAGSTPAEVMHRVRALWQRQSAPPLQQLSFIAKFSSEEHAEQLLPAVAIMEVIADLMEAWAPQQQAVLAMLPVARAHGWKSPAVLALGGRRRLRTLYTTEHNVRTLAVELYREAGHLMMWQGDMVITLLSRRGMWTHVNHQLNYVPEPEGIVDRLRGGRRPRKTARKPAFATAALRWRGKGKSGSSGRSGRSGDGGSRQRKTKKKKARAALGPRIAQTSIPSRGTREKKNRKADVRKRSARASKTTTVMESVGVRDLLLELHLPRQDTIVVSPIRHAKRVSK
eukprot:PLAT7086.10.p1 GENE.PLAT7086.10~~PLAT7086.10.p1  ORF type:complete len:976 (+),score=310.20 PLAT7086.10:367-2928(+)